MGFSLVIWNLAPDLNIHADRPMPSEKELLQEVSKMTFSASDLPKFTTEQLRLAKFGKKLFFDQRFSANKKVACATCHQPEKTYSDGLQFGQGIGTTLRRTPSVINTFAAFWFFWDGRADSLASQALGPLEHPMEHGISRTHLVRLVKDHYLKEYEEHFGKFPESLSDELPLEAKPEDPAFETSAKMSAYTLASIDSFRVQDALLVKSGRLGISPAKLVAELSDFTPQTPQAWLTAWQQLSQEQQDAVNNVFINFGKAIAQYETGIIAVSSPFDKFAANLKSGKPAEKSFVQGFKQDELDGLRLFIGPGNCTSCHMGPHFSDQQFHNIGLPLQKELVLELQDLYLDVGRSMGVLMVKKSAFNCQAGVIKEDRESCYELPWLEPENLELVGAFKTPSLRNVAERPPYSHDGRFSSLQGILEHYNEMPEDAGIGHREETLVPLNFDKDQLRKLELFLSALTSPITDLSEQKLVSTLKSK